MSRIDRKYSRLQAKMRGELKGGRPGYKPSSSVEASGGSQAKRNAQKRNARFVKAAIRRARIEQIHKSNMHAKKSGDK